MFVVGHSVYRVFYNYDNIDDDCPCFKEVGTPAGTITTEKHFWLARDVGLVKEVSVVGGGCDSGYVFGMDNYGGALTIELVSCE